jgi:hypothetical protein
VPWWFDEMKKGKEKERRRRKGEGKLKLICYKNNSCLGNKYAGYMLK